ncbi:MAG: ABC transporter ATP-binding protein [Acidobacteriota bacterium]
MPALEVHDLIKSYVSPDGETVPVIDVPRLTLDDAEQVVLHGGSGSGKTTLLNLIAGILPADSGSVKLAGTEVSGLSESGRDRLRAERLGYVFQTFNLLQGYTALENVLLAMAFAGKVDDGAARALLKRMGLESRRDYRPSQLSVGQQQRVAVARALANKPSVVLADEPTGNLDPRSAVDALALIRETCQEAGAALLLVSHDQQVLAQFDRSEELSELNRAVAVADASAGGAA